MGFRRFLAAGGVMALGAAAAAPFYHSASPTDDATAVLSQRELSVLQHAPRTAGTAGAAPTAASQPAGGHVSLGSPQVARRSPSRQVAPPRMAATFTDAVGSSLRRTTRRAYTVPPVAGRVRPQGNPAQTNAAASPPQENRAHFHTLRDGDTLALLSQRYYGSPDYAGFLFAQNRDVLKSPDLLPIGARLRIPPTPRLLAQPQSNQTQRRDPSELVPVAWNGQ